MDSSKRSHWSSRWAFILVTVGSAVGLGNIWKFPFMTGTNGGSAFVLVYLACVVGIGVPLLMAEAMLGRRGQGDPVDAMRSLAREAGASRLWLAIGYIGIVGALLILSFYSVVAGWILEYTVRAVGGFQGMDKAMLGEVFAGLLADPLRLVAWHTVFMALSAGVVLGGVTAGIERANKIMMPGLFAILLGLLGYGAVAADLSAAFRFLFHFEPKAIDAQVVLAAMGHAFFTLSLGMGAIMTYGSYLGREISIARTSLVVATADTLVALLAGLAIFSFVFAQGLEPAVGPGLILQTLPLAFSTMPFGDVVGLLFFVLVVFAAWTSSISLIEPATAYLVEHFSLGRRAAVLLVSLLVWLLGVAVALSFNDWSGFKVFGLGLFDLLDTLTSKIMMPLAGLLIALFTARVMQRAHVESEIGLGGRAFGLWYGVLRYVSPVAIVLIFLNVIGVIG
ncbi:sodium-dependent transporter [Azonexus sp.]|uniref:sodium-dependent transporter n=1 Tax=Azonexus sp. TaxID=1872668 RepID=UPI0035AE582B